MLPLQDAIGYDLVLASETIYSPATTPAFISVLEAALSAENGSCRALVAAKTLYFGVGGSVGDFVNGLENAGCSWKVVRDERHVGVNRVVGEIQKNVPL